MSAYIIVLGNEKGGTGKSTVAMHLMVYLLRQGQKVGSIDLDARQGTLSRYVENRAMRQKNTGEDLPVSRHHAVFRSEKPHLDQAQQQEREDLLQAMHSLHECDYLVIDTPGSDTFLSQLAHSYAHTLITPMNDSFIDLDMLVRLDQESLNLLKPSVYAETVWEQRKQRAMRGEKRSIDWIVLRNRLSHVSSRNKEDIQRILRALEKRIGYRLVEGFGERVVFRELFLSGLTLLDLKESKIQMTLSHVAARQELQDLVDAINLSPHFKNSATKIPSI
jgi:chromosome partitioning protein